MVLHAPDDDLDPAHALNFLFHDVYVLHIAAPGPNEPDESHRVASLDGATRTVLPDPRLDPQSRNALGDILQEKVHCGRLLRVGLALHRLSHGRHSLRLRAYLRVFGA